MARKYDFISELYNRTCKTVVANPASWEAFLRSACYNYRLRFDEQLLVHAQRPDATAVLQIDDWNQKFGRWVNRGAHGIAVFEDADQRRQRLVHYFDISDTHPSRFSRRVPIWQMRDEYTAEVIDTLESTFGELNDKETLTAAIESAARNAVEDNIPDYLPDLIYSVKDSFLDGVSEEEITHIFKTAVRNSVAYMTMTRLGIEAGEYFEPDDLRDVVNFTTPATLNALGYATSDIAEMGLAEISRTILALDRQNRIIAEKTKADYNVGKEKTERSPDDERDHLHDAGGLSAPQSDNAGAAGAVDGQVRPDAEEVPEGASQGTLLQPADELRPERASERHGAQSERAGTDADGADGSVGGRDGESESDGYDELGSEDEQYPEPGSGDRDGGGNLRLDYYDRSHEDKSLPFFGGDDTVREILGTTPHLKASKDEIRAFFEATADRDARTSYIKSIFNNDYTEVILSDGRRVGYKTYQNVLQLWEGSYLSRTAQSFYDWGVIAQHFEAMRLLGELQDTMKPLPSIDGQLSLMTAEAEERKSSAFTFSQEIIDAVLTRGSGISEGKMRIYEQFHKSLSAKENADFLKNEYGWGGAYPVIVGAGIDEQHDGKGIRISKGIGSDKPHIDLKWSQVEKRIAELIKLDRYLNPKEKAQYPEWLQKQEERRAALTEERRNREILSTAPSEKTEPENERYEYHLGSTVYLGANEYEILSFDDERVMLYDTQFPLFNKEMTRAEFDSKVQENPLNDHLKVANKQSEEKAVEFDIGMGYLGNGLTVWNRAVEVNGDYQNIAHISPEGEITFYVQDLPQSVVERIEQAAEREKPKDAALPEFYQAYLKTKADNPSSLLLYQVGDFFEAYADDAEVVGSALDLTQTTRAVDHNTRVPMVGFPQHRLETYLTMLTDRGYDVAVNALEDGKRITRTVVSTTKEAPIDVIPVPTDEAVREAESRLLGVETNATNWQRRQNANNNFSAQLPYDIEQQRKEMKEFLDDLTTRDQRMMFAVLTMVHTADTKEQLDNDTEALLTTARKHLCQFGILKFQQLDGLNTAMPFGVRKIESFRTLTTESLAVFIPFRVQDICHTNGVYYGQNVISKNMIIADRRQLLNGNEFILGVSGGGKSFTAKGEVINQVLAGNADIIIIDPEREYSPLVRALGGEIINISATSPTHINAMDMNREYGDGANPVILKSEFIMSLCEQLIGGNNLGAVQKSIIDRCTASVYRTYQQNNYTGEVPTLQDFRAELLKQSEPEAQEIALAIELFTNGSLNTFAKKTNVDTDNRLICYDILDLGKQLMPIGMLVVLDSILNRITQNRAKGKNTFIFIDEIYLLFQHEYSANFLFTLWKRVRKYGAYATGITQNVDDLLQSHTARTMLANSEFIVMLNQASTDRLELAKLLNISDTQLSYITNVDAGHGLIKVGSSLVPFANKFPKNTKLYKLMTTKPGEGA